MKVTKTQPEKADQTPVKAAVPETKKATDSPQHLWMRAAAAAETAKRAGSQTPSPVSHP